MSDVDRLSVSGRYWRITVDGYHDWCADESAAGIARRNGYEVVGPYVLEAQQPGAVDALYSAHDFIGRVLKWEGDDDTEQSELLTEIAKHLSAGGQ